MEHIRMTGRIVCFNDQGEFLAITSASGNAWVTPGGTVEVGEDIAAAAAREAAEEAGLQVRIGRLLYVLDLLTPDERVIEFFFAAEPAAGERTRGTWQVQDPDGPQRTVAWLAAEALAASGKRLLPAQLADVYAQHREGFGRNPFLGQSVKA